MKKKFYGALLVGSLFLAGGMVSCSDYDDDINSLNERVDALEKTVAELQKAIEAGAVITNVESTENGVKVTLSDGKTFEVKNGANGADGKPGSVVTIDKEGYWCIDGIRQTDENGNPYKAQGEKGEAGEPGKPGEDGKDGCWYVPAKDGYWHKQYYNEEGTVVDEATDQKWTPSAEESVRVVYDPVNGCLQISNAVDMEEGQVINIPITSNLKSLAVIPYVLDKETNYPLVFFYNIMGYETKAEVGNANAKLVVASSTNAKAHYRLNPANANTKEWDWTMIDRTVTRAAGDENELLSIVSTERDNDEFIVSLKSNKSLDDLANEALFKEHAIAALQGTNKETAEVMTSDYIKVSSKDLKEFSIITGYDLVQNEVFELPRAGEQELDSYKDREADAQFIYTESIDLNTLIKTWAKEVQGPTNIPTMVDDMVAEGELTYQFSLPAEYKLGDNETNQQDFVTLEGSILKVNTEKWPNGTGAIGTTPIVEIVAVVNNKIVATGVIKVAVVKEIETEKPAYVVTVDPVNMEYSNIKDGEIVNKFTWEDMRQVYDALKITRDEFINQYKKYTIEDGNGVILENKADDEVGTQTNMVEMSFDPKEIASNTKGSVKITYTPTDKFGYAPIVIEFPYVISHKHGEWYPEFNEQFVNGDVAIIKGQMVDGVWTQKVEISEHFVNLKEYKPQGNHEAPVLVLNDDIVYSERLNLEGTTLSNQVLTLNSEINGNELNVPVSIVEKLANGESYCLKSYTIRFVNPFTMTPAAINLSAPFPGRKDSKAVSYTVKEGNNTIVGSDGKVTEYATKTYGLTNDDVTVTYSEGNFNWAQYGLNNEADDYGNKQKLSLYKETKDGTTTYNIKWENKGTALMKEINTFYQVQVVVKGIAVMTENGAVKVTETDM
ncbi:DUF4988 domain-containing protein [Phocaeicola coprocola DSM 17136]|uniref:DUF4988 domain-containing protein n=1 Tax=Phocaeicola coprocola DSM 17136 TaxID=470145 RepID=B3JKB1_9BACT|nr:PL29 family lyase N-terminal domain-containing protein [Phocaeicola coprocola]EDV00633.1 hypothetical protein BACCOP_02340 [Phocaeicola coprocola DSM 17136]MCC3348254.1 DUF4988 domain-containing protein [Phocaeicola coprocola DSM 17136]